MIFKNKQIIKPFFYYVIITDKNMNIFAAKNNYLHIFKFSR